MNRLVVVAIVSAVFMFSLQVGAQDAIPGFARIRNDMELAKGAIKQTVGQTVLNTYIPGYGVVFMFTTQYNAKVDDVRSQIERALRFIVPSIELLPDNEKVVLVAYHEGFTSEWELMYITTKANATNPDAWQVYYSVK